MAKKKYLAVPATLVVVGSAARLLHGQEWPLLQWLWVTLSATGLVLCALLVGDLVGFFEKRFLSDRDRD